MNTSVNFAVFTASVIKVLQEKMGDDYKISSSNVKKNNGVELTGIIVEKKGCNTSPTIYADDFYEDYLKGVSLEKIAETICSIAQKSRFTSSVDLSGFTDFEKAKGQIAFKVINCEKNRELLRDVPHKIFYNLAMVYYYVVKEPPFYGKASVLIRNQHLVKWKIESDELCRTAMENTPLLFPAEIESIEDVMADILKNALDNKREGKREEENVPAEILNDDWSDELFIRLRNDLKNEKSKTSMYVLSNKQKLNGAACMMYPDILKKFADEKNCDLYILPSSIHEVILLPVSQQTSAAALLDMVAEINKTQVEEGEVLADSVYCFRRSRNCIEKLC